jgi:uncharacterized membrane protein YczE/8-oxo-dGTP pyrophosphatase MutT (NUDIX family)
MKKITNWLKEYVFTKKGYLYLLAIILLGSCVAFIQSTMMGMSSWDALNRNFYEGIPLEYKYLTPIVALVLVSLAYLIEKKKPNLLMLFPILVSFMIGAVIDFELLFLPDVSNGALILNIIYLLLATIFVGLALNIIVYCNYPLPALDQFCMAIAKKLHITFGQGKYIGEILALVMTIIVGEIFNFRNQLYYLGYTTIYFILVLGYVVDMIKYPLFRLLGAVTKIEMYADDMQKSDIVKKNVRKTSRAIIIKDNKILMQYLKNADFYILPGGGKKAFESYASCLKRELLEEAGYKIKAIEEKTIVYEYFLDSSFENHFFIAQLKSDKVYNNKINHTEEEIALDIEHVWIPLDEAITLLDEYDSTHEFGAHIMNREFLGIINSI